MGANLMFKKLLLIFIVVPLLELYIMIKIGQLLGAEVTITLVLVTGILGAIFVRAQGFSLIRQVKQDLNEGKLPHKRLLEGVCILASGLFLLTPGLLTDLAGFMLLIPPLRIRLINTLLKKFSTYIRKEGSTTVTWTPQNRFPNS
ncbi:MAG TPA: FxsA family protein [Proteobacteria bacterium]|nr:FxsA family protein [Pseudomonadota bacterium]